MHDHACLPKMCRICLTLCREGLLTFVGLSRFCCWSTGHGRRYFFGLRKHFFPARRDLLRNSSAAAVLRVLKLCTNYRPAHEVNLIHGIVTIIRAGSRICGKGRSGYRERRRREAFWRVPFEDPLWNFKRGGRPPPLPPPPLC